jgi:hypothetical protein
MFDREIRSVNGLRRHFFTKQEMTLVDSIVIDEGNSHRQLNFCKLIMDKLSRRFQRPVGLFRGCPKDLP